MHVCMTCAYCECLFGKGSGMEEVVEVVGGRVGVGGCGDI